jgi:uncharacterized protein YndB with AHSA1/START domain
MTEDNDSDLVVSRIIKAPPSVVWTAWTDPRHLKEWWCPKPWTTEIRAFDLRPGGVFDFLLKGPEGEESSNPCLFLEVLPQERIVFTSALTEGWRPGTPWLSMTAIITLTGHNEGTDYRAQVLHPDKATRDRHEEMGFFEGWNTCLKQLAELAERLA